MKKPVSYDKGLKKRVRFATFTLAELEASGFTLPAQARRMKREIALVDTVLTKGKEKAHHWQLK